MERLRELVAYYEELTDDKHQQFVGSFDYEVALHNVRSEILRLEKTLKFEPIDDSENQ